MHIDGYQFGSITIDGKSYENDVILLGDKVLSDWWREKGHDLIPNDLDSVIEAAPETLVIGTGNVGRMQVPDQTVQALEKEGIDVEIHPTEQACSRYNQLCEQGRNAAAALHLTC